MKEGDFINRLDFVHHADESENHIFDDIDHQTYDEIMFGMKEDACA